MPGSPQAMLAEQLFADAQAWAAWLETHQASSPGLWLKIGKKGSGVLSVTYAEALEVALCHGWIDGQKRPCDGTCWLQKFTPRGRKSLWSVVNREKALALLESGKMQPAGEAAVRLAQEDGRWEAAYAPASRAEVPEDLRQALAAAPEAQAAFARLRGSDRYAILFRLHTARKVETRARRLAHFIENLRTGRPVRDTS